MAGPILVPLDGEAAAERALPVAVRLARQNDVPLRLVYVHGIVYGEDRSDVRPAEAYLEEVRGRVQGDSGVTVDAALLEGNPATELPEYTRDRSLTLVVLATDPKGAFERLVEGSVSEALIRTCRTPVLLVRAAEHEARPELDEGYRRALIPLDGSGASERAVDAAVGAGVLREAHTTLVRVVETGAAAAGEAEAYLAGVAERLAGRVAGVDTAVLEGRSAADAVLALAEREDAGLLALSTHGQGGIREALFGSTADEIIRKASADLLLIRQS